MNAPAFTLRAALSGCPCRSAPLPAHVVLAEIALSFGHDLQCASGLEECTNAQRSVEVVDGGRAGIRGGYAETERRRNFVPRRPKSQNS